MWRLLLGKKRPADHSPPISIENRKNSASGGRGSVAISKTLPDNKKWIEEAFAHCEDLILDNWRYGPDLTHTAFTVYFETLLEHKELNYLKESLQDLVTHKVGPAATITPGQVISFFERNGVSAKSAKVLHDFDQALLKILDGDIVIFFNHWDKVLSYSSRGLVTRQVTESITEPVVQGPHMSAVEDLNKNIGLIRDLLKTCKLKVEKLTVGEESRRTIAFSYLEGAVNPETLAEFKRRISQIDKEEILETSYLEEWIDESAYSPFPQVRYTERPDVAIAGLLDGKIVAMVSGTPTLMICPGLFFEFFSASEDYYHRTVFTSLIRLLRVGAFLIALLLPSTYIALSTFHSELLPTVLLLAILDTREGIPFPAFMEALIMEFFFELLREAGIRLPRPIGSAVSIVGALVIGQAAIQAKIASPVMVIVVALTGIASFALPQYNMAVAIRIVRFPLMILAATLGGLGIMIGFLLTFLHLASLRSLGQPYLATMAPLEIKQLRDVFLIVPRKILTQSPRNRHLHKKNP
ncbi:spore germination protein [Paenibacillus allorhizosphaerae]|uniref:Spore germination protein A1 n=1 Tax=Paenibacillus allorhizosphaerae TaxID=2849866 RepID=A0ABN7TMV7_9BACL|nr:spore germination protein [Paenibacillus allorhizosphaerae]CAG7633084.1 Spore germination protein A1 [Paenibacillus allorhizosphaerae]